MGDCVTRDTADASCCVDAWRATHVEIGIDHLPRPHAQLCFRTVAFAFTGSAAPAPGPAAQRTQQCTGSVFVLLLQACSKALAVR